MVLAQKLGDRLSCRLVGDMGSEGLHLVFDFVSFQVAEPTPGTTTTTTTTKHTPEGLWGRSKLE